MYADGEVLLVTLRRGGIRRSPSLSIHKIRHGRFQCILHLLPKLVSKQASAGLLGLHAVSLVCREKRQSVLYVISAGSSFTCWMSLVPVKSLAWLSGRYTLRGHFDHEVYQLIGELGSALHQSLLLLRKSRPVSHPIHGIALRR